MKNVIFRDPDLWTDDINPLINESYRQIKQWGVQEATPFEWLSYLVEEVGELAKAITEFDRGTEFKTKISEEAIQVATLALKIAKMAEGYKE